MSSKYWRTAGLPVVSDWARKHPIAPRHAWRPSSGGRSYKKRTCCNAQHEPKAATARVWAICALIFLALFLCVRLLLFKASCLFRGTSPDACIYPGCQANEKRPAHAVLRQNDGYGSTYYALVGIQTTTLETVMAESAPLAALSLGFSDAQTATYELIARVQGSGLHERDNISASLAALAREAEEAAGRLTGLLVEIGAIVDSAIESGSIERLALARVKHAVHSSGPTRAPRTVVRFMRRTQRELRTVLTDSVARLTGEAVHALEALRVLDERFSALEGAVVRENIPGQPAPDADALAEIWAGVGIDETEPALIRCRFSGYGDAARRAVASVIWVLRTAAAEMQRVTEDGETVAEIAPHVGFSVQLERLWLAKKRWDGS